MKVKKYILISLAGLGLTACESDFLERTPLTEITESDFFKTVSDLETYTNGFYGYIGPSYNDTGSDNDAIYTGSSTINQVVAGNISSSNVGGGGDWGQVGSLQYFLQDTRKVTGSKAGGGEA